MDTINVRWRRTLPLLQLTVQLIGLYLRRTAKIPNKETMKVINEQRKLLESQAQP